MRPCGGEGIGSGASAGRPLGLGLPRPCHACAPGSLLERGHSLSPACLVISCPWPGPRLCSHTAFSNALLFSSLIPPAPFTLTPLRTYQTPTTDLYPCGSEASLDLGVDLPTHPGPFHILLAAGPAHSLCCAPPQGEALGLVSSLFPAFPSLLDFKLPVRLSWSWPPARVAGLPLPCYAAVSSPPLLLPPPSSQLALISICQQLGKGQTDMFPAPSSCSRLTHLPHSPPPPISPGIGRPGCWALPCYPSHTSVRGVECVGCGSVWWCAACVWFGERQLPH